MKQQLFGADVAPRAARPPRSRCRELVPRDPELCRACGGPTHVAIIGEMALFMHGGYGADRTTVFLLCDRYECRSVRVHYIVETNPRRRAA